MKTSNKLLAGAFIVVVIITITVNLMLKIELKDLKDAPIELTNEDISIKAGGISIQTSVSNRHQSTDLKDFKIVVEKTEKGIKLQSSEGSAWSNLEFNIKDNQSQAIDEYGMTEISDVSPSKDSHLADFLFSITKKGNMIILQGLEGTAWTDLSFTLNENEKQAIDQFGMTNL